MCQIDIGIDSFSCTYSLTPKQKSSILGALRIRPKFQTRCSDYFDCTYDYTSDCFAGQGIKLRVSRHKGSLWNLTVTIHPTLLLGDTDRSALFHPNKKTVKEVMHGADTPLKQIHCPCKLKDMKLYRVDVTANLIFETAALVEGYLRILKKSLILPRYHVEQFKKGEGKAKDCKEANRHSYKQSCTAASFFAYDKTAQLEMIAASPASLVGKRVLRLEVQLRRKGMRKWVSKDHMDNNGKVLKMLYEKAGDILRWYLGRLQLKGQRHVRYKEAKEMIDGLRSKKTRERMLYLLRKASDRKSLSAAIEDLRAEFGLKSGQINRVLKKFDKLGISPITLTNADGEESLPALAGFLG
ncbi:hypothetical protein [Pseudoflavonifractor phocaeensis]|uniref:hypothetical protein n=1 Tax=Pseudoflavonifractor phocaeensis TaxID=1870988 RepID=UPI001F3F2AB4|nr:hypothetical protein [Pseudoflavonifractor phocaeensis]MCF2661505.1 hypothetical protein [Pseudoflavonifractor phocaeensis]